MAGKYMQILPFVFYIFTRSLNGFPTNYRTPDDSGEMEQATAFLRAYNYLPNYNGASVEDALRTFQRFVHAPPSGHVDGQTMEWFGKARCGMPDMEEVQGHRRKRYLLQGSSWNKTSLTYKIQVYSGDLPEVVEERIFREAFKKWSDISPLTFRSLSGTNLQADINIIFTEGYHGDSQPFDGPGRILGHAYFPSSGGDQHYDKAETWTDNSPYGRNLLQTVTHEIGHSLGLRHSNVRSAVMFPFISSYNPYYRLHDDDIFAVRTLYGEVCDNVKQCLHGGTCLNEGLVSACKCVAGYSGKNCENIEDPCSSDPCGNGGVCVVQGRQFYCSCKPGFTGQLCRRRKDFCSSRPCKNGGICESSATSYKCQCPHTYTGSNCEFKVWHICNIRPCYNNGVCRQLGTSYECDCATGYRGSHCEFKITTPRVTTAATPPSTSVLPNRYSICNIPPLDAVTTSVDGATYFFKGDYIYILDNLRLREGYPQLIRTQFPFTIAGPVHAALFWQNTGETWLFQGDTITMHYNTFFLRSMSFSPSFPGVPFPIDAAFHLPSDIDGTAYFIKGTQYWKVNLWSLIVVEGPRDLREWGINTNANAFVVYNNHLYAFDNHYYYRINATSRRVDNGYPQNIAQRWFHC